METFKIFNETTIKFGFLDAAKILFGREVKVSIIIHTEREVDIFNDKTEHNISIKPFIKYKGESRLMIDE